MTKKLKGKVDKNFKIHDTESSITRSYIVGSSLLQFLPDDLKDNRKTMLKGTRRNLRNLKDKSQVDLDNILFKIFEQESKQENRHEISLRITE